MKANELRIGNLVLNDGCLCEVVGIYENQIKLKTKQGNEISSQLVFIKPVKLTDEWMFHFGFNLFPWGFVIEISRILIRFSKSPLEKYWLEIGNGIVVEIIYVNQLQNLIFSLTSNELSL